MRAFSFEGFVVMELAVPFQQWEMSTKPPWFNRAEAANIFKYSRLRQISDNLDDSKVWSMACCHDLVETFRSVYWRTYILTCQNI